ncbi:MAG: endo alpha-1,4 polygalactosaminidase [Myxococcales bacterium]|nr:endo alpha-1,4 polygalactosaminidase [Myxococcales bacterium]MCB9522495.1 endo alpha-1,4 polygalactosaminidase [Myxococcales bacterium]
MPRATPFAAVGLLALFVLGCDGATGDAGDASTGTDAGPVSAGPDPFRPDGGVWTPTPGTPWYWQLTGDLDRDRAVPVYDVDLFDTPTDTLRALQAQDIRVICYFSAGSYEEWRADADRFAAEDLGAPLDGWPGERWLDVRSAAVRAILEARLDLAAAKGCDAVEPDNVDGYTNDPGFDLRPADQLDFNRWLADAAHRRGLSVGLKNDLDQIPALVDHFDWALNEECVEYQECEAYGPFIAQGKAVFHVDYAADDELDAVCTQTAGLGLSSAVAAEALDGSRWQGCWERP